MPDIDLEPHQYRQRGKPRLWPRKLVIQFAVVVTVLEAIAVAVLMGRPDLIDGTTLFVVAMLTWPWLFFLGIAVGYLVPQAFFSEDANARRPR
jgi:hypothetical protein